MSRFFGLLGIVLIFGIAYLMSNNRKAINYKTVGTGFLLQVLLALFIFKVPLGRAIFYNLGLFIQKILEFAKEGGAFVFGPLMTEHKITAVFGEGAQVFALQLVASLIFMMILVNILYYYGIMQRVVPLFGKAMNKLMNVSGAEALSNVASAFVGQIAAQIMIRPYLAKLTRSELLASMAGSMACISAPETSEDIKITYSKRKKPYINVFDAISAGASEGMKVAINVVAMILALVALVAMIDWFLGHLGILIVKYLHINFVSFDLNHLSLKLILGKIFAVFAYFMGVPLKEATTVGSLMGTKLVLNEMVAYFDMTHLPQALSAKSFLIASFALCSFGNFGSIAIQLGGIGELAPNQRKNLARLGVRALICGTLTCYMSAAIAGVLFN